MESGSEQEEFEGNITVAMELLPCQRDDYPPARKLSQASDRPIICPLLDWACRFGPSCLHRKVHFDACKCRQEEGTAMDGIRDVQQWLMQCIFQSRLHQSKAPAAAPGPSMLQTEPCMPGPAPAGLIHSSCRRLSNYLRCQSRSRMIIALWPT